MGDPHTVEDTNLKTGPKIGVRTDGIGFKYESDKVLKVLEERGCKVDHDTKIAY